MRSKFRVIAVLVCLSFAGNAMAQGIDSMMEVYNERAPQEKVYVHFDNNIYTPGQTIFYKAYLFTGIDPASVSKTFYMDWFDEKGKLVQRVTAPILNASASGSFSLPENFTGDHLQVLAYTKWMLNFDSSFLFHRTISVVQKNISFPAGQAVVPVTTLAFFPEGGDLVEGLNANVAFKALNSGLPANVQGTIINSKGQPVTVFETVHNGMGRFSFIPRSGEEYTAEWKDPRGAAQHTKLPSVHAAGVSLSMSAIANKWKFTIERTAGQKGPERIMVVASMYQQIVFRGNVDLSYTTAVTSVIPTDKFPSGIVRVTVMDANFKPLAERVIFVNNNEYLVQAKVNADTFNIKKRGKNVFEIEMPDTTTASLSLAITDNAHEADENIISGLLLSSEIKGTVYDPAYYFSSKEDSVANQLDLVMLTNGWRRFAWENVMAGTMPLMQYKSDTSFLSISGKISGLSEHRIKKAEQLNLILMAKDSSRQFVFTPLFPDGSFREDNMILFDTVNVYYQLNRSSIPFKSKVTIANTFLTYDITNRLKAIDNFLPDTTGRMRVLKMLTEQRTLDSLRMQTTLQEVIVKTKAKSPMQLLDDRYTTGWFKMKTPKQLDLLDDPNAKTSPNLFAYMVSKVAGLDVKDPYGADPSITFRRKDVVFFRNEEPVKAYEISGIHPQDVAYIKVFPPPFFGGGTSIDLRTAAIAIYTKHYEDAVMDMKGMDYTRVPGYTAVKEFYVPDPSENRSNKPDFRTTLYWNPNIITDAENKKVKISFYNNDIGAAMQVVLEGVTDEGRLIHYSKLLK